MTPRVSLVEMLKSLAWLGAGLLWVWIALHYVSDTPTGAAVLLIPFLVMLGIGTYFYARGRGLFRKDDDATP
jgi:hypothetical protein